LISFIAFAQPDAAEPIIPKLNLGQQYIAALGLGKLQSGVGIIEAMQLRLRHDPQNILLHLVPCKSVLVHMDDSSCFPLAVRQTYIKPPNLTGHNTPVKSDGNPSRI
jgi:hypothetical protein